MKPGDYGHIPPDELYKKLTSAGEKGNLLYEMGAEILCCADCGNSGCWSVRVHIEYLGDMVKWTFSHNHRHWKYGFEYHFDKARYKISVDNLKQK